MRIAVVDDDAPVRERVKELLGLWAVSRERLPCELEISEYADGSALTAAALQTSFDVVFLDIYMLEQDGIETAALLRQRDKKCTVIFLTSSTEHMPEAFSVHAFDYILKPIAAERLYSIMDEITAVLFVPQPTLFINVAHTTVPILYSSLRCIVSDSQYCVLYAESVLRSRIAFGELTGKLMEDPRFLVVNRGILVNMDYVQTMENMVCLMNDGLQFPLNIRNSSKLRQALISYRFACRAAQLDDKNRR